MPLSLFVAFVILLIVTLLYSVPAGQNNDEAFARSASIELIDGLPFGIAVILLLHGITELMREAGIDRSTVRLARAVTTLGYVLTVLMVIVLAATCAPPGRRLAARLAGGNATAGPISP